jgi:hypothetical protein
MKMNTIEFDYSKLKPLDMVVCAGRSPLATITRIVTSGRRNAFNHGISVHTGILVSFHGQLLIAEMQSKGLEINTLQRYNTIGGKRWVISIRRHELLQEAKIKRKVQRQIALDRRRSIEYDYKGLFEFVDFRIKDNPKRNYCSEYVYELTRENGVKYPNSFKAMVSPFDLQCCTGWENVAFI